MAETIRLKDGTVEYIFDEKSEFLRRLIEDKLGYDAARCFSEYVAELQQDMKYVQESCTEYEKSADGYLQGIQNLKELLGDLESRAKTASRFTRTDVFKFIKTAQTEINNYL